MLLWRRTSTFRGRQGASRIFEILERCWRIDSALGQKATRRSRKAQVWYGNGSKDQQKEFTGRNWGTTVGNQEAVEDSGEATTDLAVISVQTPVYHLDILVVTQSVRDCSIEVPS